MTEAEIEAKVRAIEEDARLGKRRKIPNDTIVATYLTQHLMNSIASALREQEEAHRRELAQIVTDATERVCQETKARASRLEALLREARKYLTGPDYGSGTMQTLKARITAEIGEG